MAAALSPATAVDPTRDTALVSKPPASIASAGILHELRVAIPSHAVELKQSRAEAMTVVLRPDSQTAIHLQLLGKNGLVDVQAHLEHGNFQALSAQWGELQQTLSVQGIRLGELRDAGAGPFSGGKPSDGFARPERENENQNPEPSNNGWTQASPKARPVPVRPLAAAGRSWESWA
jgi:hypothetical protein